ncbi:amidase [Ottowia thiooxydans]|uniref:Amidase n=1 Tax=Ottowia thiooxydans TaxID=219182 RepID=A0ABV2QBQ6_9BURK
MSLSFNEYRAFDALGLAEAIRNGKLKQSEVLEAALGRLSAVNPQVNAVTYLDEAAVAEARSAPASGPLGGVPYFIKDLHAPVKGMPLAHGSRLFAGQSFDFDSETVARLRRAGLRILGRTASSELGMSPSTETALAGATRNPWNLSRIAGGSSGGAAAAVAAGIVPASHATDSGGSIRIPASCNGLVGLKPTRGLLPTGPHRGDATHGLSHEHAVTRSVRDCAALLDATAGPDVGAPYYTPRPARTFLELIAEPPRKLRIAFTTRTFRDEAVHPECEAAVLDTARRLEEMGHVVEAGRPDFSPAALGAATGILLITGLAAQLRAREAVLGRPAREDELEPVTWEAIRQSHSVTGVDYASQFPRINQEVRKIAQFFETVDVLLTPTMASPPVELGTLSTQTLSLSEFKQAAGSLVPFTGAFNATGQPAISLPLHWTSDGMPVGVQLVGRFGEDSTLLQLSAEMERAWPWFHRTAPL